MRCRTRRRATRPLPALAAAAQAEVEPLTRVLVRDGGKIFPLMVDAIECLRSDTKYTAIVSQGRSHLVRLPLSAFEKRLEPEPLPQDQSRLHRQPRLRGGDGSGRELAARGAAEGRHAGHREPRGLASTPGGFAMKKIAASLLGLALLAGAAPRLGADGRQRQGLHARASSTRSRSPARPTCASPRARPTRSSSAATKSCSGPIVLEVRNGRLRIDQGGAWRFWDPDRVRIEVQARDLTRVSISGAGDFTAPAPVRAERLTVSISGAGSARFERLDAQHAQLPDRRQGRRPGGGHDQGAGAQDLGPRRVSRRGPALGAVRGAGERRRQRPDLDGRAAAARGGRRRQDRLLGHAAGAAADLGSGDDQRARRQGGESRAEA